jgi:hypothetical protein
MEPGDVDLFACGTKGTFATEQDLKKLLVLGKKVMVPKSVASRQLDVNIYMQGITRVLKLGDKLRGQDENIPWAREIGTKFVFSPKLVLAGVPPPQFSIYLILKRMRFFNLPWTKENVVFLTQKATTHDM